MVGIETLIFRVHFDSKWRTHRLRLDMSDKPCTFRVAPMSRDPERVTP